MLCPKCGLLDDRVIDSRMAKEGDSIRRRRECLACGARFTTYEEIERVELWVIKRNGVTELFDRNKLRNSFIKACEKRPLGLEMIEQNVEQIIRSLETDCRREVPTQEIGLKVMEKLQAMDPVAYVRYASVYRKFQAVGDFIEEIQIMEKESVRNFDHPELFKK